MQVSSLPKPLPEVAVARGKGMHPVVGNAINEISFVRKRNGRVGVSQPQGFNSS